MRGTEHLIEFRRRTNKVSKQEGKALAPRKKGAIRRKEEGVPKRIPTAETLALANQMRELNAPEPIKQLLSKQPSRTFDLSAAPLQGLLLSGIKLPGSTLVQVAFNGSDLTGGDLRGIFAPRFGGANGKFNQMNFTGSDLREAVFTNADLTGANFTLCNLTNAIFTGANIQDAIFVGAILTGAFLTAVVGYQSAIFEYAMVNGAYFSPGVEELVLAKTIPR